MKAFARNHAVVVRASSSDESSSFSFEKKAKMDAKNSKVQDWEALMWSFQQALPNSNPNEKLVLMDKIYDLNA